MRLMLRVFKVFNSSLPRRIADKFFSDELEVAVKYFSLRYNLDLSPQGIIGASIFLPLLLAMTLLVAVNKIFNMSLLLSFLISLFLFLSLYFYFSTYLSRKYGYERNLFAKYSYFVLEELYLALISTGSLIDAMAFIGDGGYPKISKDFRNILFQCSSGSSPDYLIKSYAFSQPSTSLREGLMAIVSSPLSMGKELVNMLSSFSSFEVRRHFRNYLVKLELYCLIIIMQGLLSPISIILLSSLFLVSSSIFLFVLIPVQLFFLVLLSHFFMKQPIQPVG